MLTKDYKDNSVGDDDEDVGVEYIQKRPQWQRDD